MQADFNSVIVNIIMDNIKIGVVGVGRLGAIHAKIYKDIPGVTLTAICDKNEAQLEKISRELQVAGFKDYRQLFDKVKAVSIATPTQSHFTIAWEFLKNKIHVLVEKPITATLKEADKLTSLARKNKVILQVGHVERFNAAFSCTRKIITQPRFIECHRLSSFPNRSLDVGVVLDIMIHDIDIVLGLMEQPIKKIEAVGVNVLTPFEDIANARITFANGCIANLTASRVSDEVIRKIRIFQEDTYISLDYKQIKALLYRKKGSSIIKEELPIDNDEPPLQKELSSFVQCIQKNQPPLVSGETAKKALEVALRIQNKIWKKRIL